MNEEFLGKKDNKVIIRESLTVSDPKEILIILHEQRMQILNELLHSMKNIQELSESTHLNPGTVKRNLEELMVHGYVFIADIRYNEYKMKMKYYQATAKEITIKYKLPEWIKTSAPLRGGPQVEACDIGFFPTWIIQIFSLSIPINKKANEQAKFMRIFIQWHQ